MCSCIHFFIQVKITYFELAHPYELAIFYSVYKYYFGILIFDYLILYFILFQFLNLVNLFLLFREGSKFLHAYKFHFCEDKSRIFSLSFYFSFFVFSLMIRRRCFYIQMAYTSTDVCSFTVITCYVFIFAYFNFKNLYTLSVFNSMFSSGFCFLLFRISFVVFANFYIVLLKVLVLFFFDK